MRKRRLPSTVVLTHYGRRSGRPYRVRLWYAELDGRLWVGSLDARRQWVRNLAASGQAAVDFGRGPRPCRFLKIDDPRELARYERAIEHRHPVLAPLLRRWVRGPRCAFASVEPFAALTGD